MLTLSILPLIVSLLPEAGTTTSLSLDSFSFTPDTTLLLNAPQPVLQEGDDWNFSYTYVEVGATRFDLKDIDDTADIYYGEAAIDLFDLIYVFLGYENASIDFDNTDTDIWRLGAGAHFGIAPRLDLLGDIAWSYSDLSGDTLSGSSSGSQVRIGARWLPWQFTSGGLELNGRALWVNQDDSYFSDSSQVGFDVGARVHFMKLFSVGALYTVLEDDDAGSINARVSF